LGHVLDRQRAAVVRHEGHGSRCHQQHRVHGETIRFYAQRRTGVLFEQVATANAHIDGVELSKSDQRLRLHKKHYRRKFERLHEPPLPLPHPPSPPSRQIKGTRRSYVTDIVLTLQVLENEFEFWMENRMVTFQKDGKSYTMARYYAPSRGPRPESYRCV